VIVRVFAQEPLVTRAEQAQRSWPRSEQGPPQTPQWINPENIAFGRRMPFSRFDCASRTASMTLTYLSAISL
jgi:hypothetical protein